MADTLGQRRRGLIDAGFFDSVSGSALALVVDGAGGTPADLVAVTAVMGRLGPGLCGVWGCESDWEAWSGAVGPMLLKMGGDMERFSGRDYLAASRSVDWSVGLPPKNAPAEPTDPLSAVWPRLDAAQKDVVRALLKSWHLS